MYSDDLLIFGVGSPHGEDSAGWRVVQLLKDRGDMTALEVGDVSDLLNHLPRRRRAVIVDACRSDPPSRPGTITRLVWPDERIASRHGGSSHGLDVGYALRIAEQLGSLPVEIVLYGIEIAASLPGDEIQTQVDAAIHEVADRIAKEWLASTES